MQLRLDGTHAVTSLAQTPSSERNGEVSPDGRWLAYEANDSGRFNIYVRPFPDVSSGYWQVSTDGGTRPLWARNSQELFYLSVTGALMRVEVALGPTWAATAPTKLFEGRYGAEASQTGRTFDIAPDGQRFLMIKPADADRAGPTSIVVVQNWTEELKRLYLALRPGTNAGVSMTAGVIRSSRNGMNIGGASRRIASARAARSANQWSK